MNLIRYSYKTGVKLVDLEERLKENAEIQMVYRQMINLPDEANEKFINFAKQVSGEMYTSDIAELVNSANGSNTKNGHHQFFCSKVVPDAWVHMGILETNRLPNNYNLLDFLSNDIPFKGDVKLGKIKYIVMSDS